MTSRLIVEQVLGHAALAALLYWWLGYAESGIPQLLLSLVCVVLLIAGTVFLAVRARGQLRATVPSAPVTTVIAVLLLPAALAVGYLLVWWVPQVEGFTAQALSMVARWGLAYLLVLLAWLNLLGKTPQHKSGSVEREGVSQ
jgi:hypothetical protein